MPEHRVRFLEFIGAALHRREIGAERGRDLLHQRVAHEHQPQALAQLRALAAPQAWVMRDKKLVRVPGSEIVPGDVVLLASAGGETEELVRLARRDPALPFQIDQVRQDRTAGRAGQPRHPALHAQPRQPPSGRAPPAWEALAIMAWASRPNRPLPTA